MAADFAVTKVGEGGVSQQADKAHGCLIWPRRQVRVCGEGHARQQGVRGGRKPVAAAAPDLARQVGDGGNAIVAVHLHDHVRIASLCGQQRRGANRNLP